MEGFTSSEDQEQLQKIEKQIRRRFVVGSQVSESAIVQDLVKQVFTFLLICSFCSKCLIFFSLKRYNEKGIYKVLQTMIRRGEVQHRAQRKLLYRLR